MVDSRPLAVVVFVAYLCAAGCAQLNVQVSVLDDRYWSSDAAVKAIAERKADAAVLFAASLERQEVALAEAVEDAVQRAISPITSELMPLLIQAEQDPADVAAAIARETTAARSAARLERIVERFVDASQLISEGLTAVNAARNAERAQLEVTRLRGHDHEVPSELAGAAAINAFDEYRNAALLFSRANAAVEGVTGEAIARVQTTRNQLVIQLRDSFGVPAGIADPAIREAFVGAANDILSKPLLVQEPQTAAEIQAVMNAVTGGVSLLADPDASLVLNAPGSFWQAKLNEAYAAGQGGNVDIAIRMAGTGSFTIKGVRVDASDVTRATFQSLRFAVSAVAAIHGVPTGLVKPPSPPEKTDAVAGQATGTPPALTIDDPRLREAQTSARIKKVNDAVINVLDAIAARAGTLEDANATADERKAAVQQVKQAFTANRPSLVEASK